MSALRHKILYRSFKYLIHFGELIKLMHNAMLDDLGKELAFAA